MERIEEMLAAMRESVSLVGIVAELKRKPKEVLQELFAASDLFDSECQASAKRERRK